eukprot:30145-Pelagococcus_subviridis.AAC.7
MSSPCARSREGTVPCASALTFFSRDPVRASTACTDDRNAPSSAVNAATAAAHASVFSSNFPRTSRRGNASDNAASIASLWPMRYARATSPVGTAFTTARMSSVVTHSSPSGVFTLRRTPS